MNNTIYIHIGDYKTGSTAIQRFLYLNREKLKELRYLYPGNVASHGLLLYELKGDTNIGVSDPSLSSRIIDEIRNNREHNVIISSENLSNHKVPDTPDVLKKFLMPFLEAGYTIKIILYCRRQDHRLESAYKQFVKNPETRFTLSPEEFFEKSKARDYYQILENWRKVFSRENIKVRIYEKEQLKDIFHDFIDAVDLEWNPAFQLPDKKQINKSPGKNITEIIRLCNKAKIPVDTHIKLLRLVEDINPEADNPLYLSPQQRISILEKVDASNRKIAKEYLGRKDGRLFYEPWPDPASEPVKDDFPDMETVIPELVKILVSAKSRELKRLRQNEKLRKDNTLYKEKNMALKGSVSYKLGRFITYPFRIIGVLKS